MTKNLEDYYNAIGQRESSGRLSIVNPDGYLGKYQMGAQALEEAGYYKRSAEEKRIGKNIWNGTFTGKDGVYSKDNYLHNAKAQDNAMEVFTKKQWNQIKEKGLDEFIGKEINGIVITPSGMSAAAHLIGVGNLEKYLKSNGSDIRTDGNNTTIEEYLYEFRDYNISKTTNIPHKEYDTFENYLKSKGKGELLNKNPNIEKRNKKEFEGKTEPKFVTEANKWNEEVQKEAKEYKKYKEEVEKGIYARKKQKQTQQVVTGGASSVYNTISNNSDDPLQLYTKNDNERTSSQKLADGIDNDEWDDNDIAFLEAFLSDEKDKHLIKQAKEKRKQRVKDKGNKRKGPNGEDGYWYTTKQGKHVFVPDDKTA